MAKRKKSEFDFIKSFVDGAYSRMGNVLLVDTSKKFDPESSLGYCFKHKDPVNGRVIYRIVTSSIGIERTDFRVMMHEYGHIYLGHMDGIHEELDSQILDVFSEHRGQLIDEINESCGIDFADKLIERVIDDPVLNHSLHNIAMDMEVNSKILSKDDIEEMEMDITSVLPKYQEEALKYVRDHSDSDEEKQKIDDVLKKMEKEAKIKLILPERYHCGIDEKGNPIPFPSGLTYAEYLLMIIENLDQFVKMLVSIQMGGNGDTSDVTKEMIKKALEDAMKQWNQNSDEYKQGYQDAQSDYQNGTPGQKQQQMNQQSGDSGSDQGGEGDSQSSSGSGMSPSQLQDYNQGYQDGIRDAANGQGGGGAGMQGLSGLMGDLGMSSDGASSGDSDKDSSDSDSGNGGSGDLRYKGMRKDPTKSGDGRMDHRTDSRDEADQKRKLGKIRSSGGIGCGDGGGPDATREVDREVDEVDMALNEVMQNVKARVIKSETRRDVMRLYNRGIIRSVIAPSISRKVTVSVDPKVVYLIDISGSMDTRLVDRILKTIGKSMRKLNRGLKYDIITWSTRLGEHIKDIDPKKGVPRISMGGGTSLASGIQYFKDNYGPEAILIVISDFEDYLEEWHKVEETMNEYSLYGFNYGDDRWQDSSKISWKNMKIRKFHG